MNRSRLGRVAQELAELVASPRGHKAREFIRIVKQLGRVQANRGKEPAWIKVDPPAFERPLTIPNHGNGADIKIGTACIILDQLRDDVDVWKQWLLVHEPEQPISDDDDDDEV